MASAALQGALIQSAEIFSRSGNLSPRPLVLDDGEAMDDYIASPDWKARCLLVGKRDDRAARAGEKMNAGY
jgi:hypothetical protein